ncbi:MAG: hypothetical protein WBD87_14640 [Candidatus Acidiferrales bacterium]
MRVQRVAMLLGICAFLAGLPAAAAAQQTSQSLGDAARKAKEQQKQAPKAKIVWTNDNLPTSASVSVVGQPSQQDASNTSEAQPGGEAGTPPSASDAGTLAGDLSKTSAELAEAQKKLDSLKTDLDIAQREYKLDSNQYYSTPNYAADQQGQAKLDADKSQIAAKQQAMEAAQKKVDDLQKQVDSLNEKLKTAVTPAPKD